MSVQRKPVAFGHLPGWTKALEAAGDMREVDWNVESRSTKPDAAK